MATSYYKTKYDRKFTPGQGLPTISTDLDSVRAYQFEIHFFGLPADVTSESDLTLAAKKVSGLEMKNEAIYDPITGEMTKSSQPGGTAGRSFKAERVEVVMLDNTMTPHSTIELYGVYPMSWAAAEFNYSTNSFHQLTVNFKYDFMNVYNYANPT